MADMAPFLSRLTTPDMGAPIAEASMIEYPLMKFLNNSNQPNWQ
jgi:hypothetical protein